MLFRPLETERLRLEPIRREHADAMFEGLHEPSLYDYETDEPPSTLAELRERYAALAEAGSAAGHGRWLNWVIVAREGGAAGYVQATVRADRRAATIGYLVLPAFQRRGIGREAVGAMADHLTAAGIGTLEAVVDVRNAASIALLERIGFRRVRTRRSDDVIHGVRGMDHEYVRSTHDRTGPEAESSA